MKLFAGAVVVGLHLLATAAAAIDVLPIALTGEPVPNGPPGAVFEYFGWPSIDDRGHVAFIGAWNGGRAVIGPGANGQLRALIGADGTLDAFSEPHLADPGRVFELARESGACDPCDAGIWESLGDSSSPVYVDDHGVVGEPLGIVTVNRLGDVIFVAEDSSNTRRYWVRASEGDLRPLLEAGQPVPGGPPGALLASGQGGFLNAAREIALTATLQTFVGGVTLENDRLIVSGDVASGLSVLLREGDPAPAPLAGAQLGEVGVVGLNDAGQLFVQVVLVPGVGGVTSSNDEAILRFDRNGSVNLVARKGQEAPGIPGASLGGSLGGWLSDRTRIAFGAFLEVGPGGVTPEDSYVLLAPGPDGPLTPVARAGQILPGLEDAVRQVAVQLYAVNDRGDTLFSAFAEVQIEENWFDTEEALYFHTESGDYRPVMRRGDPLEVAPGDLRTIERFYLGLGFLHGWRILNDSGQAVALVQFTDGSEGIFLFSIDPIACANEIDDDGDGTADFPDDPGCAFPASATESPACDDGADNDGDGAVDFGADPQCRSAADPSENAGCGIGFELALVIPVLLRARARRTRAARR